MVVTHDYKAFNTLVQEGEKYKNNCLAFSAGQTGPGDYTLYRQIDPDTGRPINPKDTPCKPFIHKMKQYGFKLREVKTEAETEGKIAFWLWGWFCYRDLFGKLHYDDFHVIRRNPDGSFEHKPDGTKPAEPTSLEAIQNVYGYTEKPYIFVHED